MQMDRQELIELLKRWIEAKEVVKSRDTANVDENEPDVSNLSEKS
jgi:hypothetical protein